MKRFLLLSILLFSLCMVNSYSQTYHESDKEGLRKILRTVGVDHDRDSNTGRIVDVENVRNFEYYGLEESDTLNWYISEDWIAKLTNLTWNNETPKRIIEASFGRGVEDTYFDISYFKDIEDIKIAVAYFVRPVITSSFFYKIVNVNLSENSSLKNVQLKATNLVGNTPFNSDNDITSLSITEYTNITVTNDFLQLIPKIDSLEFFKASSTLDFSNNTELKYLNICKPINSDIRHEIQKMNFSQCHKLEELYCSFGILNELVISHQVTMKELNCSLNKLDYLKMPCNPQNNPLIENYVASGQFYHDPLEFEDIYVSDILDLSDYVEFGEIQTTFVCTYSDNPADEPIEEIEPGKFLVPIKLANSQFAVNLTNPCFGGASIYHIYNVLPRNTTSVNSENIDNPITLKTNTVAVNSTFPISVIAKGEVSLYNMSGKQVNNTTLSVGDNYIISPSANGVYMMKVSLDNGISKTYKVVVK